MQLKLPGRYNRSTLSAYINNKSNGTIAELDLQGFATQHKLSNLFYKAYYEIENNKVFALIFYEGKGVFSYKAFTSDQKRDDYIKNIAKDFTEIFFEVPPNQYNEADVSLMVEADLIEIVKRKAKEFETRDSTQKKAVYFRYDMPASGKVVYTLVYDDNDGSKSTGKVLYFKTVEARESFITKQIPYAIDKGSPAYHFRGVPNGMMGEEGVIKKFHLEELLVNPGDTFTSEFDLKGVKQYAMVKRESTGELMNRYISDPNIRSFNLSSKKNPCRDLTAKIKGLDHSVLDIAKAMYVDNLHLDKICVQEKHYWLEPNLDMGDALRDILCFRSDGKLKTYFFEEGLAEKFIEKMQLVDVRKSYEDSYVEYSQPMGAFLTKVFITPEIQAESEKMLNNQEYIQFPMDEELLKQQQLPDVFMVLVKNEQGKLERHYFKTEGAANEFIENCGYADALLRDKSTGAHSVCSNLLNL